MWQLLLLDSFERLFKENWKNNKKINPANIGQKFRIAARHVHIIYRLPDKKTLNWHYLE